MSRLGKARRWAFGCTHHEIDSGARSVLRIYTLIPAVTPRSGFPVEISRLGLAKYISDREELYAGKCFHARCGYRQAGSYICDESAVVGGYADQFVLGD